MTSEVGAARPPALSVAELARTLARAIGSVDYVPMSGADIETQVRELLDTLVGWLRSGAAGRQPVVAFGERLVTLNVTARRGFPRSVELLAGGLPRLAELADVPADRVAAALGALVSGYAEGTRLRVFAEQDNVVAAAVLARDRAERMFAALFEASPVGIAIDDLSGRLTAVNPAFAELVGRRPGDLVGFALEDLFHLDDRPLLRQARDSLAGSTRPFHRPFHRQLHVVDGDGLRALTYVAGSLLRDADDEPTGSVTTVENVSELQRLQHNMADQSLHDPLTYLPNRGYFYSHLDGLLGRADQDAMLSLLRIGLDRFRVVNDGLGPAVGDKLLRSVGDRLSQIATAHGGLAFRVGGDEFALLLTDGPAQSELGSLAEAINDSLAEPTFFDKHALAVSAGIGIVHRRAHGISADELLRAGDATLHQVKRTGPGQWGVYDGEQDAADRERYRRALRLPLAHENGELTLRYQPLYGLETKRIVGMQALLTWYDPDTGEPDHANHEECLALAALTGLVRTIGPSMLAEGCRELAGWRAAVGDAAPRLRMDLTRHLARDPDLVGVVLRALESSAMPADWLRFGMPVPALTEEGGDAEDNIRTLADLGVGIVLLDASGAPDYLRYLQDLPIRFAEVAPATVQALAARGHPGSLIANGVIDRIKQAHDIGVRTIAAGVDTAAQADWWARAKVDTCRGEHFAPPVRAAEVLGLLARS